MRSRSHLITLVLLLFGGILVALAWIRLAGGQALLRTLLSAGLASVLACLALTASWHLLRFVRWQFLLRRIDVRVPIRPALGIYLAGGAGTATPAYVAESLRSLLLHRRFRIPYRATLPVLVLERILDVVALALLLLALASSPAHRILGAGILAGSVGLSWLLARLAPGLGVSPRVIRALLKPSAWLPAVASSLAAWGLAGLILGICASSLSIPVPPMEGARIYWTATLLGGLTLMPAGVGVTGSIAIVRLMELGTPITAAVAAVSMLRFLTVGLSLLLGSFFLARELTWLRRGDRGGRVDHFHELRHDYLAQFPAHVWDHLTERKLSFIQEALQSTRLEHPLRLGLDLGCGVAAHAAALAARGYDVVGLDPARGLLHQARRSNAIPLLQADARRLPFPAATFDFIYAIGVLHHLEHAADLRQVLGEARRVLRPGGRFIVLETNPLNPLFRFYMGYVFPLLRRIDEGVERWIAPAAWTAESGLHLADVRYFTFMPDFLPRWLMGPALRLERSLEGSSWRTFSVHYMAVLERPGT